MCFKAVRSVPLGGGGGGADSVAGGGTQEHAPADNNLPLKGALYVQSIGDVAGGGGGGLSIQKLVCNQAQCTQLDTHLHLHFHLHYQQPLRQNS